MKIRSCVLIVLTVLISLMILNTSSAATIDMNQGIIGIKNGSWTVTNIPYATDANGGTKMLGSFTAATQDKYQYVTWDLGDIYSITRLNVNYDVGSLESANTITMTLYTSVDNETWTQRGAVVRAGGVVTWYMGPPGGFTYSGIPVRYTKITVSKGLATVNTAVGNVYNINADRVAYVVTGQVIGSEIPLDGAVVSIVGPIESFNTTTNSTGHYNFTVAPGTYDFTTSYSGFVTNTTSVTVSGDDVIETILLTSSATPTPTPEEEEAVGVPGQGNVPYNPIPGAQVEDVSLTIDNILEQISTFIVTTSSYIFILAGYIGALFAALIISRDEDPIELIVNILLAGTLGWIIALLVKISGLVGVLFASEPSSMIIFGIIGFSVYIVLIETLIKPDAKTPGKI